MNRNYRNALVATTPEHWAALTKEQKVSALQAIEAQAAKEQIRLECPVLMQPFGEIEGGQALGHYDPSTGHIVVNERLLESGSGFDRNPDRLIETTLHEGRHAYQDQAAKGIVYEKTSKVDEWRSNMDNYIKFENNPKGYWNQPLEADAREYADMRMRELAQEREEVVAIEGRTSESQVSLSSARQAFETQTAEQKNAETVGESQGNDYGASHADAHTETASVHDEDHGNSMSM